MSRHGAFLVSLETKKARDLMKISAFSESYEFSSRHLLPDEDNDD